MSDLEQLKALLSEIDSLFDSYDSGVVEPNRIFGEIIDHRAAQRPLFERIVQLATEGLAKFPFNAELLRRRSLARTYIVTPEMDYPELELAEQDLRTLIEVEPSNLYAAFDLLESRFIFSGLEDEEVAELAAKLAAQTEKLLRMVLRLQIKALGYADDLETARAVFARWSPVFPDSESLKAAMADAEDPFANWKSAGDD